jgi:hypothetical protein
MKKRLIALSAAILMTLVVGIAMLGISAAALHNQNGVVAANSTSDSVKVANTNAQKDAQIQQLQDLVTQYQTRELQYQQREQQYQTQINQATTQIQQVQALLQFLQSRGLIFISSDGRIMVNQ